MSKMFSIIKKHYLFYYGIFIIAAVFVVYKKDLHQKPIHELYWLINITLFGPLLFGTIQFISHEFYRKWKLKRNMNSIIIKEFIKKGFKREGNLIFGKINEYTVVLDYIWHGHDSHSTIRYRILFDPKSESQFFSERRYNELLQEFHENRRYLGLNCIVKEWKLDVFLNPEYKEILNSIVDSIKLMKGNNLQPIEYYESETLLPEIERYSQTLQNFAY